MGGACSAYGGWESCVRVLVGKPEGNRSLRKPRHRWEDNIIRIIRIFRKWDVGVWTGLSWLRIETGSGHL
jgi:hypothetical protein